MGQKVHPYGFRLGYNKTWRSRWFAKKDYAGLLHEDLKLRKEIKAKLASAGVSSVEIERPGNKLRITIHTARPGIIIGRKGAEIDRLRQEMQKRTGREVRIVTRSLLPGRSTSIELMPADFSCERRPSFSSWSSCRSVA